MAKEKACKNCRIVYSGQKCPQCGSTEYTDGFKGKINIFSPEESEIAKNLGIKKKGIFAVRLK